MLMLTQEFKLNDVLRLWDSLLSQTDMYFYKASTEYLYFMCLALIISMKDDIMGQDFSFIMQRL